MGSMPVMPRRGDWSVEDLEGLPDDGLQYELVDGILLVTPAPRPRHQVVLGNLHLVLRAACPADLQVFLAPLDYQPTQRRSLQPDLLVVRREDVGETNIERPLLLAVEILSPSTWSKDPVLKRALYAESGVASYWVVDPDEPSIVVLELERSEYVERGRAVGDDSITIDQPFRVVVTPSALFA